MRDEALTSAIQEAGGTAGLARLLGISSQAISQWTRAPAERVLKIEQATGVPRHKLRPDLYPPEDLKKAS